TGISPGSCSALSLLPEQNATGNWIKIVQRVPVRIEIEKASLKNNGTIPVGTSITTTINTNKNESIEKQAYMNETNFYKINNNTFMDKVNQIIKMNSGK
ncbi:MAG: HlyD family secretion protein, partial [Cetobacterium sp.]|nr:HlyD family secretion protein [Cetobacterium sp.]